jgi:hypothetical protein
MSRLGDRSPGAAVREQGSSAHLVPLRSPPVVQRPAPMGEVKVGKELARVAGLRAEATAPAVLV